ncbi:MAG: YicC/YloC family endoribonuclease [Pirellulaceae bacterium]|nr:YicC/YloC family endoribonuclease [Pirellulaceae bacterium]
MLLSMTGQGHARGQLGDLSIDVEVRSVNNRFLKVTSRVGDRLQSLENQIEPLVRELVRRGTVQVSMRVSGAPQSDAYRLNSVAIEAYARQAISIAKQLNLSTDINLSQILLLPGVVDEKKLDVDDAELQSKAKDVLHDALIELNRMRESEGKAMGIELTKSLDELRKRAAVVAERAPSAAEEYGVRLQAKMAKALQSLGASVEPVDLLREVQLYADRCDIREELVRLESHFNLFENASREKESQGRKLDFLVQELNREINTVGSKANDVVITEQVVNMKTTLEQVRELIQNIE